MTNKSVKIQIFRIIDSFRYLNTGGKFIKEGFWSLIINILNKVINLIIGILLIRFLGKAEFGRYSYVLSLIFILIVPMEFGVTNLVLREIAQAFTRDYSEVIIGVWRWSIKITIYFSSVIMVMGFVFLLFWGDYFVRILDIWALVWGIILLPIQSLIYINSAALRSLNNIIIGQILNLILIPLLFVVLFLFNKVVIFLELTAATAMVYRLFSTLITFILSLIILFWKFPMFQKNNLSVFDHQKWLKSVINLSFSSGLNIVKLHSSVIILGMFVSANEIGTYQIAVSSAALASIALQTINTFLAPHFAALYAKGEKNKLQKLVTISTRLVLMLNLLITITYIIFGKSIIKWVFGPETVDAYPVLLVLLIGQLINSFMGSVVYLLNMTGYEKDVGRIIGFSTILNTIIVIILTPIWGAIGTSIAISTSLSIAQIALYYSVKNRLGIISNAIGVVQ